ncbi:M56 family metallopeptidase [Pseudonocardia kunmingensis]|uniref:Peptidase M48-like protein n=1 Tax=Pseudonocardia kunmingensis TaxID=630975 RepID=A0A543DKK8_9PSEU|nr:M56 family metallopeptidase [Pseudonocardia kunmingensis]TQM09867.1 peptidase M48-like protein [Pseudonocardia kunmingensis]
MTLAILLVLYSLTVAVLAPPVLDRITREGTAPRLAITAWAGATGGVLLAWVLAAALIGRSVLLTDRDMHDVLIDCFDTIGRMAMGSHGAVLQMALLVLATLSVAAVAVLIGRLAVALGRARMRTHQHCRTARLVADRGSGPEGSVVLDTAERTVYCVAGRPPTIVITRGALEALDDAQLAAVLAHERAHLSGRHHLLIASSRAVATVLPHLRVFPAGAAAIGRLIEMRADDVAVRRHPGSTLVSALLTLSGVEPVPGAALGASSVGLIDRVERLLAPPDPRLATPVRFALMASALVLLVGPVAVAGLVTLLPHLCPFPLF